MVSRMQPFLEGLREFRSPYAPQLVVLAARLTKNPDRLNEGDIYVAGKGVTVADAEKRLQGEAAERDALYLRHGDTERTCLNLLTETSRQIPAAEVMRSHPNAPDDPGSSGCAAHNLFEQAAMAAIGELIERRAVFLWWNKKAPARRLPGDWLTLQTELGAMISRARRGAKHPRYTRFFLLMDPSPIPVVTAWSSDADGGQIAVAFASGTSLDAAAGRAFLELLSVELETADLAYAKAQKQPFSKNSNRGLVEARQKAFQHSHADLFPSCATRVPDIAPPPKTPKHLLKICQTHGQAVELVDLTRVETGLPVYRAIYADRSLQPHFATGNELSPL